MTSVALAAGETGDRRRRARLATGLFAGLLFMVMIASLCVGPLGLAAGDVIRLIGNALSGQPLSGSLADQIILFDIRLPRTLLAALVGAAFAIAGAMMQGLFRNPLADPGLVGVSAGAALGAVLMIVVGPALLAGAAALPVAAFIGGLATTMLLDRIATRRGRTSVGTMLLAGIALGALTGSVTAYLVFRSDDLQLREFAFWSMGGLGGATWPKFLTALPLMAGVFVAVPFAASGLDALMLGEAEARHLGVDVQRLKAVIILVVALAIGISVAFAGVIGFVGIVVPHVLRLAIGPEHRALLPSAALLGAALLIAADMVCRTIVAPAELPIGIVTAMIGAPFFLSILLRQRGVIDL